MNQSSVKTLLLDVTQALPEDPARRTGTCPIQSSENELPPKETASDDTGAVTTVPQHSTFLLHEHQKELLERLLKAGAGVTVLIDALETR